MFGKMGLMRSMWWRERRGVCGWYERKPDASPRRSTFQTCHKNNDYIIFQMLKLKIHTNIVIVKDCWEGVTRWLIKGMIMGYK